MEIAVFKIMKRIYHIYCKNMCGKKLKIYGNVYEDNKYRLLNKEMMDDLNYYIKNITKNDFKEVYVRKEISDKNVIKKVSRKNNNIIAFTLCGVYILTNYKNVDKLFKIVNNDYKLNNNSFHFYDEKENYENKSVTSKLLLLENTPILTTNNLKGLIVSNNYISKLDKEIIINSGILDFASKYVNENREYAARLYNIILPNLKIKNEVIVPNVIGDWNTLECTIRIDTSLILKDESYLEKYKDVLLHELIHVLQPPNEYSILYEGCAYIIGNEFQTCTSLENFETLPSVYSSSNNSNMKYTAMLMECVGIEPVIRYNFTGDIEPIKNELKKYLSKEDIDILLEIYKTNKSYVGISITMDEWNNNVNKMEEIYQSFCFKKNNKLEEKNISFENIDNHLSTNLLDENMKSKIMIKVNKK